MNAEDYAGYKRLYRKFVDEVINGGNFDLIPALYSPDYIDHNSPPGAPGGLGGVRAVFGMFRTAFPDIHFDIDEMVAEGDRVATRVTGHGTNTGSFMGAPPSGKAATWTSKGIFRVDNGRIAEHWGLPDLQSLMSQLGVLPPQAQLPSAETPPAARPGYTPPDPYAPRLLERNKAVVRRFYDEGFSRGDTASFQEYVAKDFVDHLPARFSLGRTTGPEALAGTISAFRSGFPDLSNAIQDLIAEGSSVVARTLLRGIHRGAFIGVQPTGKAIDIAGFDFFRIGEDGTIVERFGSLDTLGMMQQLGIVPSPGHTESEERRESAA